ncbi:ABC transporter permease [Ahniella affigens]|uniref:ABC transporter permease n=1 Tax=Ahniella affigens TaxID=2021234 RepID=A0A2P1PNB1_9GAMM|nr:ABC transporter permease [Ahniella affigens]
MEPRQIEWRKDESGRSVLAVCGAFTMPHLSELLPSLDSARIRPERLDLSQLDTLDSAGALVLLRTLVTDRAYVPALDRIDHARPAHQALLKLVAERAAVPVNPRAATRHWQDWVIKLGEAVSGFGSKAWQLLAFLGTVTACFAAIMLGRRKLRMTSVIHHMERTGLDAVPIVSLLCFLVGAVVAFLSATALRDFGASILTVEIVAVSFLREFGVLLSAILVAGRSGSAFTAEIGSMRSREEIDAIQALALDPIELLVIPRLVALLFMMPVLAFIAMLSGILGGALVGATALDISPTMFLVRMRDTTELYYLWLGLLKAPVFAVLIAAIGCLEGLKVSGSAESVGRHTTSSVVQSIFLVIVCDALFAVLYMKLDL